MKGRNYIEKNIFTLMAQERGYTQHQQRIKDIKKTPSKINEPAKQTRKYNQQYKKMRSASAYETQTQKNQFLQMKNDKFLERLIQISNRKENEVLPKHAPYSFIADQYKDVKQKEEDKDQFAQPKQSLTTTSTFFRMRETELKRLDHENRLMVERLIGQKASYKTKEYKQCYKTHQKDVLRHSKMANPLDKDFVEEKLKITSTRIQNICKPSPGIHRSRYSSVGGDRLPPLKKIKRKLEEVKSDENNGAKYSPYQQKLSQRQLNQNYVQQEEDKDQEKIVNLYIENQGQEPKESNNEQQNQEQKQKEQSQEQPDTQKQQEQGEEQKQQNQEQNQENGQQNTNQKEVSSNNNNENQQTEQSNKKDTNI